MSLIERAAKRLEELRRAGVEVAVHGGEESGRAQGSIQNGSSAQRVHAQAFMRVDSAGPLRGVPESDVNAKATLRNFELDLVKLATLGFVTPDVPRSRIADEFRILKRPLIANMSDKKAVPVKHGNLIMVTSSVPGEGKTFSAVNLAMSLATELDRTVLLVDADVARPSLPALLGLPPGKGLLDVLDSKAIDLSDVLIRTNVGKLSILPSGNPHPQATELLASSAMAQLLDEMSARYADRIIIFDSPPLLVTTESRVLATQMGQIVFVVHAESTLQSDVKRALATIESCPIKMMVLNQARTVGQGAHGYGYGYGYGS
ncbi:MAG: tyrosine-protein kinase family protein [Betaproteobacteria bacterium]|nr:tyrosine-protein kinase family protein [Betaproteobacteria bacterium]